MGTRYDMRTRLGGIGFAILILLAWLPAGHGDKPSPRAEATAKAGRAVVVFAAASVTDAMDEIRTMFAKQAGVAVEASYAASSTLARQVVHGAEADLLISADTDWVDYLDKRGFVASRRNLLTNRLVIIVPIGSKANVKRPEDLASDEIEQLALGEPASVPAGRYAKQALTRLGLWDRIAGKVASAEDVRHALYYVETGSADAGIVYATDAAMSKKVKIVAEIPEKLTGPVRYPLALLKHGEGSSAAEAFYRYLASPEGTRVFEKYGFTILKPDDGETAVSRAENRP
jgi:molybdate transport system substrate-binding protein